MDNKAYYIYDFTTALIEQDKSEGTIKTYKSNVEIFIKFYIQTYDEEFIPQKVILMDLQDWRVRMLNQGLKGSTINNRIAAVKEYFGFLERSNFMDKNPTTSLKKIKLNNGNQTADTFSLNEYKKIKRTIYKEGNYLDILMFELFSKSGIRVSEAINLKISDLVISERIGGSSIRVLGKGRKERFIPLNISIHKCLDIYFPWRAKHKFKDSPFLLISERGEKFSRSGIYKRFLKYQYLTDIEIHPHKFRSFFATQIVKSNPIQVAQKLLGHESITTTQKYLSVEVEDMIDAIDSLKDL